MIATHDNRVYEMTRFCHDGKFITQATLRCGRCRHVEPLHIRPDLPPEVVLKKFQQKGWITDERNARRCICPTCQELKKKDEPMTTMKDKLDAAMTPTLPQVRRILGLVEGHFDEDKGHYLGGWDDKKIAAELNMPWAMVAKVREESGLKIKGDPEVLAIQAELATLMEMAFDLTKRVDRLVARK